MFLFLVWPIVRSNPTRDSLLNGVSEMSFESGQARAFLQQYLLNQLVTSKNVYVKLKVLKLLEELLEKGHIEFKQNMRKQPEPLNEASSKEKRRGESERV